MDPLSSISGLASGVQWRELVDQIMGLETQRRLDPVTTQKSLAEKRIQAWSTWQSLATKFRDAAKVLRDASAFAKFKVTGGTSPTSGRTLFTATAGADAAPGSYDVEVLELARANKLSGSVYSNASTALGLSGEFAVNGGKVTVSATDSLYAIRDKINALNSGTTRSRVSASVLSTGASQFRLVLTAEQSGASGIEFVDDAAGTLQSLGLIDGTTSLNMAAGGGAQSNKVPASTAAIATMLGIAMPQPSTINIGGRVISVDLTVDSLASIAARIMAAGGNASVVTETSGGQTGYRLVTNDTVSASTPDGLRALEVLGFSKAGRAGVAQQVTSENVFTDAADATSTASTLITDLKVNGNSLGIAVGDTMTFQGRRGDGTTVNLSFVVGASDTMQTVLDTLNDATTGFGAGGRPASATFVNGQVVLTDTTAGDSQLSLTMSVAQSGGGTVNLGRVMTTAAGRSREIVAGSDARVRIDGVVLQRSSNTITDALAGVTLNLQAAELGTSSTLTVDRDTDAVVKAFSDLAAAYNELVKFRDEQSKTGAPLHMNSSLRAGLSNITSSILSTVTGASSPYTTAGIAGLSLQKDGTLKLDSDLFKKSIAANLAAVTRLFTTSGYATNADVSYFSSTGKSVAGSYAINVTAVATTPTVTGAGFSGTYADDATADTLTISEALSGQSGSIQLANGDTIDTIVTKLNSMFSANGLSLSATKTGNDLTITGTEYGSAAQFTVSYTAGGADGSSQLGLAAATHAGTDVAGTIGGLNATGAGQYLTGVTGGVTSGLTIQYSGTSTGAQGSIDFVLGVSGALFNAADLLAAIDGSAATQQDALKTRVRELQVRADTVQQALDRRREALVKQFVGMEAALGRLQQQSANLSSFITSLSARSD